MEQKNTNAVAGLVLGIVCLVLLFVSFIPFSGLLSLGCGIVGLILSVKGRKIEYKKGMATAGMVLSIIGLSIFALAFLCLLCVGTAALGALGSMG